MARAEEVVLPLPSPRNTVPRATKVRGMWLGSSTRGLKDRGLFDRYLEHLPAQYHEVMTHPAASEWYPIDVVVAHYRAADKLEVPTSELLEMGRNATRIAHASMIGVAAKLVGEAGASPWVVIGNLQRLWERTFVGGAVGATRIGPKEARIEVVQWPCAQFRHCRVGIRGVAGGMAEILCAKAYVNEVPELCTPLSVGLRLAWV